MSSTAPSAASSRSGGLCFHRRIRPHLTEESPAAWESPVSSYPLFTLWFAQATSGRNMCGRLRCARFFQPSSATGNGQRQSGCRSLAAGDGRRARIVIGATRVRPAHVGDGCTTLASSTRPRGRSHGRGDGGSATGARSTMADGAALGHGRSCRPHAAHGYVATREAAMAAYAKSWRKVFEHRRGAHGSPTCE
jgi:hypothetical protein